MLIPLAVVGAGETEIDTVYLDEIPFENTSTYDFACDFYNVSDGDYCAIVWREKGNTTWIEESWSDIDGNGTKSNRISEMRAGHTYELKGVADFNLAPPYDHDGSILEFDAYLTDEYPDVQTLDAENVEAKQADLKTNITEAYKDNSTFYKFQYWETGDFVYNWTSGIEITASGNYSRTVYDLKPDTNYSYRAYIYNESYEYNKSGSVLSFETLEGELPTIDYYCSQVYNKTGAIRVSNNITLGDYSYVNVDWEIDGNVDKTEKYETDGEYFHTFKNLNIDTGYLINIDANYSKGDIASGLQTFYTTDDIGENIKFECSNTTQFETVFNYEINISGVDELTRKAVFISFDNSTWYTWTTDETTYTISGNYTEKSSKWGDYLNPDTTYYFYTYWGYENTYFYSTPVREIKTRKNPDISIVSIETYGSNTYIDYYLTKNKSIGYTEYSIYLYHYNETDEKKTDYYNEYNTTREGVLNFDIQLEYNTQYYIEINTLPSFADSFGDNAEFKTPNPTAQKFANIWGTIGALSIVIISFIAFLILYFTNDSMIFLLVITILTFIAFFMQLIEFVYVLFTFMFMIIFLMLMSGFRRSGERI